MDIGGEFPDQYRIHETEAHRKRQLYIAQVFADRYRVTLEVTPRLDRQDFRFFRHGRYAALGEIKDRNNPIDQYPDYAVDRDKIDDLLIHSRDEGVEAVLLVSWRIDDMRWFDVKVAMAGWTPGADPVWPVGPLRRGDRKERTDLVYHMPLEGFRKYN